MRDKNFRMASVFDRRYLFEAPALLFYGFIVVSFMLWYYGLDTPTDEQSVVSIEMYGLAMTVVGLLKKRRK